MNSPLMVGSWQELGAAAYAIRYAVFVLEQGVPVELEQDEHDAAALHVVVQDEADVPIATGRLLADGHIGRIAVLAPYRGRGIGRRIMDALMTTALGCGQPEVQLHAQVDAQGFYAALGFELIGEPFSEAGIMHICMRKLLA